MTQLQAAPPLVAALYVRPAEARDLIESVFALLSLGVPILVGSESTIDLEGYAELNCELRPASHPADLLNQAWSEFDCHVLAVGDAISLPDGFRERLLAVADSDLRIATVSFFSNDAGYLSFPQRNHPTRRPPQGHDAESVSRALGRGRMGIDPVPILMAAGPAVLLTSSGLGAVGELESGPERSFNGTIADYSSKSRDKGFVHVLDDLTFIARRRSAASGPEEQWPIDDIPARDRHWFYVRHPKDLAVLQSDAELPTSPVSIAHSFARAKVNGLRVAVDGYDLGPHEMGTQVGLLSTIDALVQLSEINEVLLVMSGPVPPYAHRTVSHPKVKTEVIQPHEFPRLGRYDIAHRLAQPNPGFIVPLWKTLAERVIVSVLDMIAYRVGAYHANEVEWLTYRETIRRNVSLVDAVTVISDDVGVQVEAERLVIDKNRLEVIPFGTEHLPQDPPMQIPTELLARGFTADPFFLCVGTDYAHKNRDLAIAAIGEMEQRGWPHKLVLAGPSVPYGASKVAESEVLLERGARLRQRVLVLPEVSSPERNWLLRHADAVLYPSSAEGFGLIPYEAAQLGTPTVFVGFGPLIELAPDVPVTSASWSPGALADALEAVVADAEVGRQQVEACLSAGSNYTWDKMAHRLRDLYFRVLAMPPRTL